MNIHVQEGQRSPVIQDNKIMSGLSKVTDKILKIAREKEQHKLFPVSLIADISAEFLIGQEMVTLGFQTNCTQTNKSSDLFYKKKKKKKLKVLTAKGISRRSWFLRSGVEESNQNM
jgi:hypothetical protein